MKVYDMIVALEQQGKKVEYVKRKDGGYRITQIGRKKYTGKEGNKAARSMLGQSLSEKQIKQRQKATKAAVKPQVILHRKIEASFKKATKLSIEKGEEPLTSENREKLERKYGTGKRLYEVLQNKIIKLKGIAYANAVEELIARLEYKRDYEFDEDSIEHEKLVKIIKYLERHKNNFSQSILTKIFQSYYEYGDDQITENDLIDTIFDDLDLKFNPSELSDLRKRNLIEDKRKTKIK